MRSKIVLITVVLFMGAFAMAQPYPKGLSIGEKAPGFTAKDNQGNTISLASLLKKGEVVLLFYRGQWCPYCNKQLSNLNDSLTGISTKGATLLAVTPETMENVTKTIGKTKASFPIISDNELAIMKIYQVAFQVDQPTQDRYKNYGIDFMVANGSNGANLPVPATYVIGKDGKIKYVFFNPDYRQRPSVKDIIEHL